MTIWTPSDDWLTRHTHGDLVYRVRLRLSSPQALDSAWLLLGERLRSDGDGALLDGGAALIRVGEAEVEVISGGEDALDSLGWTVNQALGRALGTAESAKVIVVAEERALDLN